MQRTLRNPHEFTIWSALFLAVIAEQQKADRHEAQQQRSPPPRPKACGVRSRMTGFILSPAAQIDAERIWDYTATKWNVDQAEHYIQDIRDACRELVAGVRLSRPVDVREGYIKACRLSFSVFLKQ